MLIEKIEVDNLKCGGCANTIKTSLQKIKGVEAVQVFVEEELVEISHDGTNKLEMFLTKLTKMGYPKSGTSTVFQKGKSYVSCAIGRMQKEKE